MDKDAYLLELCRYIVLNPLRAKAVKRLEQWPWSSYAASDGAERPPAWLAVDRVHGLFANVAAYRRFVAEGLATGSPWEKLRGQMYLGSEAFLERMQRRLPERQPKAVSSSHLHPSRPTAAAIEAAVAKAYRVKGEIYNRANPQPYRATIYLLRRAANLPLAEVAKRAGISPGRVSQIQTEIEKNKLPMPLQKHIAGYKLKP